ncbi:MAG: hypothetical protein JWP63_6796 [Candidatus Solibacter sp.]|nr:hypothetical protein [Candidatus Solibacter sp.]
MREPECCTYYLHDTREKPVTGVAMALILWKRRERLRMIEQRARETADPMERLRYVRGQMDGMAPPEKFQRPSSRKLAALIAAALGAALLLWRIS